MSLFTLFIEIALIGVVCWAITTYIAMAPIFKNLITAIGVIFAILLALSAFGVHLPNPSVPQVGH